MLHNVVDACGPFVGPISYAPASVTIFAALEMSEPTACSFNTHCNLRTL